jgi:hypothetical protein
MLTQKGREPFVRMRIFLDDPTAVDKLIQVLSNQSLPTKLSANDSIRQALSIDSQVNDQSTVIANEILSNVSNGLSKSKARIKSTTSNKKSSTPIYELPKVVLPSKIEQ